MDQNGSEVHHMSRKSLKRQLNGDKNRAKKSKKIKKDDVVVAGSCPGWLNVDPVSKSPKFVNKKKEKLVEEAVVNVEEPIQETKSIDVKKSKKKKEKLAEKIVVNDDEVVVNDDDDDDMFHDSEDKTNKNVKETSHEIKSIDVIKKSKKKKEKLAETVVVNDDEVVVNNDADILHDNEEINAISVVKKSKKKKKNSVDDNPIEAENDAEIIPKPKKAKKNKQNTDDTATINSNEEISIDKPKTPKKNKKKIDIVDEEIIQHETPSKKMKKDHFDVPANIESLMEKKMKKEKSRKSIQIVARSPSVPNDCENVELIKDVGRKSFCLTTSNTDESDNDEVEKKKEPVVEKIPIESQLKKKDKLKEQKKNKSLDQSLNVADKSQDDQQKNIQNNLTTKTPDKKNKKAKDSSLTQKVEKKIIPITLDDDDVNDEEEIARTKALLEEKAKMIDESKKIKNASTPQLEVKKLKMISKKIKPPSPKKTVDTDRLEDEKQKITSKKIKSPSPKKKLADFNKKNNEIARNQALLAAKLNASSDKSKIDTENDDDDDEEDDVDGEEKNSSNDSDVELEVEKYHTSNLKVDQVDKDDDYEDEDEDEDKEDDKKRSPIKNQLNKPAEKDMFSSGDDDDDDDDDDDKPQIPKKSPAKTPKIIKTTTDNISSSKKSDNKIKVTKKTPKSSSVLTKEEKINDNGKDNDDDDDMENQQDMEKIKKKLFKKQKSQQVTKTFVDKSTQTIESSLKSKKSTKNNTDADDTSVVKTAQAKKTNIKKSITDEAVQDEKKNVVSDEELEKLKNMKIKLIHEPPSQHLIENNPANHQSSPVEREEFEKFIKIKKGFYNNEEDHLITKNWNEFCILHDWDKKNVEPFINLRYGKKYYIPDAEQRKNFFRFLGNGLDNRPLSSIFTRFSNLYSTRKTQRFTIIEDDYINKYLLEHTDDSKQQIYAHLTTKLNRPRDAIARRIRMLQTRGSKPKKNEKKNTSSAIKDDNKKSSDKQNESPEEQHESPEEQHQSSEEQHESSEEQHQSSEEQHQSSEEEQKSSSEDETDSD